jgi:segregation and condensation protein A
MAASEIDQDKIWETYQSADRGDGEPALVVDVDGFEGPHFAPPLARGQKSTSRVSRSGAREQYLTYIEQIRLLRLELAADYLVVAAWLFW